MNIWEAYCEPNHYAVYFDIVRRQLGNKKQAENLKSQFQVYLHLLVLLTLELLHFLKR